MDSSNCYNVLFEPCLFYFHTHTLYTYANWRLLVSCYKAYINNRYTMSHLAGISFCGFSPYIRSFSMMPAFVPSLVCVYVWASECLNALIPLTSSCTKAPVSALTGCQVFKRLLLGFLREFERHSIDVVYCTSKCNYRVGLLLLSSLKTKDSFLYRCV